MSKIAGKGTILKSTISATLTAVAQITSISTSGFKSETYESTCLDTGVGKTKGLTGYAEGGTCDVEIFYDPGLAGHQFYQDSITTPVEIVHTITYTDASVTTFTSSGIDMGVTVAMDDGLKSSLSFEITGIPSFA
jgi:hypothetical protein